MAYKFDLCHDFSFWERENGRCIPMKMKNHTLHRYYTFPPLCNRTERECGSYGFVNQYCPNKDESCEDYDQEKHFFCNKSKTCIPKGKFF